MTKEIVYGVIPLRKLEEGWQVLLVQHKQGDYWSFTTGHSEEGEEPLDTAVRELKEETGLEIDEWMGEMVLSESYAFERDGEPIEKTVFYTIAKVSGAIEIHTDDILSVDWFDINQAEDMITFEASKDVLRELKTLL